MKKLIILTAVTAILFAGGQKNAWAGDQTSHDNDEYKTFKKIVRVLDVLVNDGRHKETNYVYVKECRYPRRICYVKRPYKVCRLKNCGPQKHGYQNHHKR